MSKKSWKNKFGVAKSGVLKEFTVYRGNWATGGRPGTRLLGEDGFRCCIGFMARACRVPDADLLDQPTLRGLKLEQRKLCYDLDEWPKDGTDPFGVAYDMNDRERRIGISDAQREKRIAAWFKKTFSVKVRFVDGKEPK